MKKIINYYPFAQSGWVRKSIQWKEVAMRAIEKIDRAIENHDIKNLGFAGLRKLIIQKWNIQGKSFTDADLASEVEKIRIQKLGA